MFEVLLSAVFQLVLKTPTNLPCVFRADWRNRDRNILPKRCCRSPQCHCQPRPRRHRRRRRRCCCYWCLLRVYLNISNRLSVVLVIVHLAEPVCVPLPDGYLYRWCCCCCCCSHFLLRVFLQCACFVFVGCLVWILTQNSCLPSCILCIFLHMTCAYRRLCGFCRGCYFSVAFVFFFLGYVSRIYKSK